MKMNKEKLKKLEAKTKIGKPVYFKNKDGSGYRTMGIVEDEVYIIIGEYKQMIQRIKFAKGESWDGSEYAYRTGYYTYDKKGVNIKWGQYTQFLTQKEYKRLLEKAKEKGWDIF